MSLFGNPQGQTQQDNGQASGGLSFVGVPMDRRPQKVPLGRGTYEIIKVGTRLSPQQFKMFYAVLKCIAHENAANVGGVYEFNTMLQGLYVKDSLADIKRLLVFSFGKQMLAVPENVIGAVLDKECLQDDWKKFNETQALEGQTVVGNKVRIFGQPGKTTKKDGTPKMHKRDNRPITADEAWPRYYFDPADA